MSFRKVFAFLAALFVGVYYFLPVLINEARLRTGGQNATATITAKLPPKTAKGDYTLRYTYNDLQGRAIHAESNVGVLGHKNYIPGGQIEILYDPLSPQNTILRRYDFRLVIALFVLLALPGIAYYVFKRPGGR